VECFKVNHRIECWGFIFREKKNLRKINLEQVKKYKVSKSFYENLHRGEDYVNEKNELIKNEFITNAVEQTKSYSYCADNAFY
jgi:ribonuclease Z